MDLLGLDVRLEKNIRHLEKSLVEYEKLVTLVHDIELKKNAFELYVNQLSEAYEEKWKDLKVENEIQLSDLNGKVNEKIKKIEEENKRALREIINAHTVNEKESIEAINTNITKLKSESERSLIDLSSELFKETMRAEDKDRKLAKNIKIFMAISSVIFIVLLIWR